MDRKPVNDAFISKTPSQKSNQYIPKPWCSLADGAFQGPQQIELSTTEMALKYIIRWMVQLPVSHRGIYSTFYHQQ